MLGQKIRDKRIELGLSIKDLSESTGLTSGFISQVERDQTEPSITSLRKIAKGLDVAVFYFFVEDENNTMIVRKGKRQKIRFPDSKLEYDLLSPDLNRRMEMFYASLQPGADTCEEPLSHPGEEVLLVLTGELMIQIDSESYHLLEGDSIYYFASSPHRIVNCGKEKLEFVSTITPPRF